jgi:hypothetical protein
MKRIIANLLNNKIYIKVYILTTNKKVNFINIKLFVGSQPDVLISKVIFGYVELSRKNTTHDLS